MDNMFKTLHDLADLDLTALTAFKNIWLDPVNGGVSRSGKEKDGDALSTLALAYAKLTTGKNERIMLVGDGATTATARVDAAFTWSKRASSLIGVAAPTLYNQRARIANTAATTAFANFFTVSGDGNVFRNLQFYHDFTTDTDNQIAMTVSGHRNVFKNCHFAGIAKGSDAGGRNLYITGQENLFEDCVIGLDTIDRSAANASVEFASGAARNVFRNCIFPFRATATTPLLAKVAATNGIDRFNIFDNCIICNFGTATIAGLCTLVASAGGYLLFKNCMLAGQITGYGTDANSRGQIYISGAADGSTTSGIGYNPSA